MTGAILRTTTGGLIRATQAVATGVTLNAVTGTRTRRKLGTGGVPGALAAERIEFADAGLANRPLTTRTSVGSTTVATARTASIGKPCADRAPASGAAGSFDVTDTLLNTQVVTAGRVLGGATRAFAHAVVGTVPHGLPARAATIAA